LALRLIATSAASFFPRSRPSSQREEAAFWTLDRDPGLLETNVPGIFVVGDVRHGSVKRVAPASAKAPSSSSSCTNIGEGSMTKLWIQTRVEALVASLRTVAAFADQPEADLE